jgi:hypothetical protein
LSQIYLESNIKKEENKQEQEEDYISSSLLSKITLRKKERGGVDKIDLCFLLPRSVTTIDSFETRNPNFILLD